MALTSCAIQVRDTKDICCAALLGTVQTRANGDRLSFDGIQANCLNAQGGEGCKEERSLHCRFVFWWWWWWWCEKTGCCAMSGQPRMRARSATIYVDDGQSRLVMTSLETFRASLLETWSSPWSSSSRLPPAAPISSWLHGIPASDLALLVEIQYGMHNAQGRHQHDRLALNRMTSWCRNVVLTALLRAANQSLRAQFLSGLCALHPVLYLLLWALLQKFDGTHPTVPKERNSGDLFNSTVG